MWYTLLKAHSMDPGFLPKNVDAYDQALRQVRSWFSSKLYYIDARLLLILDLITVA